MRRFGRDDMLDILMSLTGFTMQRLKGICHG
jgi:hypothetical protein